MSKQILILVHPGSLCGSADYNLGSIGASELRTASIRELDEWSGGFVVLDGYLSFELPQFPGLASAIDRCLARCSGIVVTSRLDADDPTHAQIALRHLQKHATLHDCPIVISGAWFEPSWVSGCVNLTFAVLRKAGFSDLTISNCAARCQEG